jgi:hypothetical protein
MKKLLLLLFSLLISFNSYGEWTKVNMDVDSSSYYIDFATVKKIDGYVVWWEMRDKVEPDVDGYMSVMAYIKGDCESTRTKFLSVLAYEGSMGEGDGLDISGGIFSLEEMLGWRYPPPTSVDYDNLNIVCSLADQSSMNNYQSKVLELIAEFESYEWEGDEREQYEQLLEQEVQAEEDLIENQKAKLQSAWIRNIAAEVRSNWNFPGAEDGWFVEVLVTQNQEGEVLNVKSGDNNVGNSVIAKRFIDSVERAVYKSSPLPVSPDASVWQKDILFTFYP